MAENKIKPCPFCGSAGYVKKNPFTGHYSVECNTCGAKMAGVLTSSNKAIEKWNGRADDGRE